VRISREKLLNTLELVTPGLATRGDLEHANCYIFKDKKVITYNDETACQHRSELDVTGAVKAEPLRALLQKLKEDEIEVFLNKASISIKGKSTRRAKVRLERKIELPLENLEKVKRWKSLPGNFGDAVDWVKDCAGRDENRPVLTYIHITPRYIEAFDNNQFARFRIKKLDLEQNLLVKQISLRNIISLAMIEFCETKNWVHFRNARRLILSCRRWIDEYPPPDTDFDAIAAVRGTQVVLPKGLAEAADRAEIFSVDNVQQGNNVRVDFKAGWIKVSGTGQYGRYSERRKIDYEGKPFAFLIPPKMLMELVKKHSECQVSEKALKAELGKGIFVTSLTDPNEKVKPEKETKNGKGRNPARKGRTKD
jgi:hypothetical protein